MIVKRYLSGFLVLSLIVRVACRDRKLPHQHRGVLKPYEPGPFEIDLTTVDEQQLSEGKAVMKQVIPEKGSTDPAGGAICIQDIDAPKAAVWNQILRMNEYVGKVPKVKECKNYDLRKNGDGSVTIKTRQKLGILPGYAVSSKLWSKVRGTPT